MIKRHKTGFNHNYCYIYTVVGHDVERASAFACAMRWLIHRHLSSHCRHPRPLTSLQLVGEASHAVHAGELVLTVDRCLKIFQAHPTRDQSRVSLPIPVEGDAVTLWSSTCAHSQFNFAGFLVVAERAGELSIQWSSHPLLRRSLSLRLSPTHISCPCLLTVRNSPSFISCLQGKQETPVPNCAMHVVTLIKAHQVSFL